MAHILFWFEIVIIQIFDICFDLIWTDMFIPQTWFDLASDQELWNRFVFRVPI